MNQRQLASVLLAVLGIFMAATRLPDLAIHAAMVLQLDPAMEEAAGPFSQRAVSWVAMIAILIVVFLSLALVLLRDRISDWLFSSEPIPSPTSGIQAVALSVLGVYFVISSIPGIMWPGGTRWASVVQAVLGAALFLGAHGTAALWYRLRTAGLAPHERGQIDTS